MSVARTARRRRRQAAIGYAHMPKQRRPRYRVRDVETSRKRLQQVIETERRMKQKGA